MLQEQRFELPATCPDTYCSFGSICGIAPLETEQLNLLALPEKPVRKRKTVKKEATEPSPSTTEATTTVTVNPSPFDWF